MSRQSLIIYENGSSMSIVSQNFAIYNRIIELTLQTPICNIQKELMTECLCFEHKYASLQN